MNINFLWIGDRLDKMGQLTLKSFIDHGHNVVLWLYDKNCKNIPQGTVLKDAGEIIEPSKVFSYKGNGDCRFNSYGGFSDIFRYYLLQEVGGWYCDMDVTCFKNFEDISKSKYVIRPHKSQKYVANIIKTPPKNDFLKACIEKTEVLINENNDSWIKPLQILADCIREFKLEKYEVSKDIFGDDNADDLIDFLSFNYISKKLPTYALHWCNEAVSTGRWDITMRRNWDKPVPATLFYKLLKKHNLL